MTKEEVYDFIKHKNIWYEITEHKRVFTMDELDNIVLPYPEADAKNLFIRDDKKLYLPCPHYRHIIDHHGGKKYIQDSIEYLITGGKEGLHDQYAEIADIKSNANRDPEFFLKDQRRNIQPSCRGTLTYLKTDPKPDKNTSVDVSQQKIVCQMHKPGDPLQYIQT